ncbi:6-carboxytetrahydropterin synthase QueD [Lachnospiraceae bacterium NSJ-143]|nr:6-carboxytetrahydropterin synthase QueD [Lachnospiraceae bacterium NSJ-143]
MYTIKTKQSFDSAHFLQGYEGKCRNIHGHRWTVEAEIYSETIQKEGSQRGMIVDFGDLKRDLKALADYLDHALIIERGSLKEATLQALTGEGFRIIELDFRPTAENLAEYVFDSMVKKGYKVRCATVFETPDNCAVYFG